jgi:hypothetical protein
MPSGDGDRDMSRKVSGTRNVGERKPFEALPLTDGGEAGIFGLDRRLGRRCRAEPEGVDSDSGTFSETSERRCRRAADRVVGAKYPSRASDLSEREGDGEMTRGVAGTEVGDEGISEALRENGGSAGAQMRPKSGLAQEPAPSQARLPGINGLANNSMMGDCDMRRRVIEDG